MEHLIIRLLLEEDSGTPPPTLKEILAVTFTRAAVRDMRRRLHSNLEKTLHLLHQTATIPTITPPPPDYLQAILEQGERARLQAIRRIESALNSFEECSLYTLHGFCAHSLSEHPKMALEHFHEDPVAESIHRMIRHFFRTHLHEKNCHPIQLQKVLSLFRSDVNDLEHALIKTLSTGVPIAPTFSFADAFPRFCAGIHAIQREGPFTEEKILSDWHTCLPRYKQLRGKPASDFTSQVARFAQLIQHTTFSLKDWGDLLEMGLPLAECEEKMRLKPLPEGTLSYPYLPSLLRTHLLPLLEETLHPERIFAWMAGACQELWKGYQRHEGAGGPDRLVEQTVEATNDPEFVAKIRAQYRVVLVDEFQDTDPLQWQLLKQLFLHQIPLVLVGDPKQSIYAFRHADLYTYYAAAKHFPKEAHASLRVNYRSDAPLVHALNSLFSDEHTPELFDLPKLNGSIPYPIVRAAPSKQEASLQDGGAAIEFWLHKGVKGRKKNWPTEEIERDFFLPECVKEIIALHQHSRIPFSEMAVLVRDRIQAAYVHEALTQAGLPAFIQKRRSILHSESWKAWVEWIEAMLFPEEASLRQQALVGLFMRCPEEAVISQNQEMQEYLQHMIDLRELLETKGLSTHAEELFFTPYKEGEDSLFAHLLRNPDSREIADELQQILELMLEHQAATHCSLYGLFSFLCTRQERLLYEEPHTQARLQANRQAISIVTMHMSKGLEFDIVFSLGTAKRGSGEDLLLHDTDAQPAVLRPYSPDDPLYLALCLERDAEKIRHAYVAMTRAKKRLYISYAIATDGSSLSIGEASPLDLLFARLNQPKATLQELYPRLNTWQGDSLCAWIDAQRNQHGQCGNGQHGQLSIRYRFLQESSVCPQYDASPSTLVEPATVSLRVEPSHTLSYTQCAVKERRVKEEIVDVSVNVDLNANDLPEGKDTGIFLHHLLATLSWQRLSTAQTPEELHPLLASHIKEGPWKPWTDSIAKLLHTAWHTPLPLLPDGNVMRLAEVHSTLQSREMEFLYQDDQRPTTVQWKGAIDLFLSHEGLYYLIDWKSHCLGERMLCMGRPALEQIIQEQGLLLQAKLYTKALRYYLQQVEQRPFSDCFGGFAFLFLRGLSMDAVGRGVVLYGEEELR